MAAADQSDALQDAIARAKEIAAKLQQQDVGSAPVEDVSQFSWSESKKPDNDDPNNSKVIAMQVAQALVQRAELGSMFRETMRIPGKLVGLVIGRNGEMIHHLQTDTNAKIQVAPDPPPERAHEDRQVTLTGTPEAVAKAKNIIQSICDEGKIPFGLFLKQKQSFPEFVIELMIPSEHVGEVIGKDGETIRYLKERSDCKMVLIQDGIYEHKDEKPLRITGEREKCEFAQRMVVDLITQKELEQHRMNQDVRNTIEYPVPMESIEFVIGKGGETISKLQEDSQCVVQFKNDVVGSTKIALLTGTQEQIDAAKEIIDDIVKNPKGDPHQGRMNQYARITLEYHVPIESLGFIIGKGGVTIRNLQEKSRCLVEFKNGEVGSTIIAVLTGTQEQIDAAKRIIDDIVKNPKGERSMGGPQFVSPPGGQDGLMWDGRLQPGDKMMDIEIESKMI